MKTSRLVLVFLLVTGLSATAQAKPSDAKKNERAAHDHVAHERFCEAAASFAAANEAKPDKRYLWNAALAAERAGDTELALEELKAAKGARGVASDVYDAIRSRVETQAQVSAAYCPRHLSADATNAQLRARVRKLGARLAALVPVQAAKKSGQKEQAKAYEIPVEGSPTFGAKKAPVDIVVFSEFQCPFCARLNLPLHEALEDPRLKGKVRVVFKHFPLSFHKDARRAAHAGLAAREQGEKYFWKMGEKLYANQRELTSENFSKWAEDIGLDVRRFERDLKRNHDRYEAVIERDIALGTNKLKVRGTPSIFVDGWYESGARNADKIVEALQKRRGGQDAPPFLRVLTKG